MRGSVAILIAVLVALMAVGRARADADPASDTLYEHKLYRPYFPKIAPAIEAQLRAAIRESIAAGKEVRVALIESPNDLGGIPSLFGRPTDYARFLDAELQFVYSGRVLVVMPQGAGLAKGGRLVADRAVLAARPKSGANGLARTAIELVQEVSGTQSTPTPTSHTPATPAPAREAAAPTRPLRSVPKGISIWIATGIAVGTVAIILAAGSLIVARRRQSLL
jgi:hypothetical protein